MDEKVAIFRRQCGLGVSSIVGFNLRLFCMESSGNSKIKAKDISSESDYKNQSGTR
jgi:hypothetical protein